MPCQETAKPPVKLFGVCVCVAALSLSASGAEQTSGSRMIAVNAGKEIGDAYNFWSVSNFTSEDMFAQPEMRERTVRAHPFMRYVNCVRLLGGRDDKKNEWFQSVAPGGAVKCDFTSMAAYLRGIQDWGFTPRIVLDNVPTAMSEPPKMNVYGNTYPPRDYAVYHRFIKAAVQAMADAFGKDVVAKWRFRVGTEPDLYPGHWAGTKEEYLRLYDYAVDAVTQVIPEADIGPGNVLNPFGKSEKGTWGLDVIDHAATGRNYRTGATGTRLRYISCSWYGRIGQPIDTFEKTVRLIRRRLETYPQFRGLPVEMAEFGVLNDEKGNRFWSCEGTEWSASWLAAIADRAWRLNVGRIHLWATVAPDGLFIPYTHVLWMLERMGGGRRVAGEATGSPDQPSANSGAIACVKDGHVFVLAYNHSASRASLPPLRVALNVGDARMKKGQTWKISEWLIDEEHSGFMRAFCRDCEAAGIELLPKTAMFSTDIRRRFGEPGSALFKKNIGRYREMTELFQPRDGAPVAVGDGAVSLEFNMPSHSVRLLEIAPGDSAAKLRKSD